MSDPVAIKLNVGKMIDGGATEREIDTYLASEGMTAATLRAAGTSVAGDVANSALIGIPKGPIQAAGLTGDIQSSLGMSDYNPFHWAANKFRAAYPERAASNERNASLAGLAEGIPVGRRLTSDEIQKGIEGYTGEFYTPKTPEGRIAQSVTSSITNPYSYAGAASLPRAAVYAGAAGAGGEIAGQKAEGTKFEPWARIAGALAGVGSAAGASKLYTAGANRIAAGQAAGTISDVVGAPVGAGAARRLANSAEADNLTPATAGQRAAELGDEAMLLDTGRQLRGRAEAIAAQPGRGQNALLDAVEQRTGRFGEGTADRVRQTLDAEMGPTHNVVQLTDRVDQIVDQMARPLYRKVMDEHPVVNIPSALTERPAIASAMRNAESLAKQYGEKLNNTESKTILAGPGYHIADDVTTQGKTSLRYWDYVKKDLDRRINAYMKSGGTSELNSADKADLGGLIDARKALVSHLDDTTSGAYREARQAAATKYELREGLEFGRTAFNSRLLPEEFAAELADMSVPARTMAQAGFRRELDRLIEASRNEGATARQLLDTNQVLAKAEQLFGPRAAAEIERRIGAENVFQQTTQDIAGNSRTPVRQQLIKDTSTPSSSEIRSASLPGLLLGGARSAANYIRTGAAERTRGQIADVLTASGNKISPIVEALTKYNTRRAANNAPVGGSRAALINSLLQLQEKGQSK